MSQIISRLNSSGYLAWRNQSGSIQAGKHRLILGTKGLPDILYIDSLGQFGAIEVKRDDKQKLRESQVAMAKEFSKRGILYQVTSYHGYDPVWYNPAVNGWNAWV